MKEKRMLKRLIKGFLCMVIFTAVCIGSGNVKAAESTTEKNITINETEMVSKTYAKGKKASKKAKKAIAAYKKYLSKKKIKWGGYIDVDSKDYEFSLVDVNRDGIPELFLHCNGKAVSHHAGYEAVFVYCNKKIVEVHCSDKITSYYPKTGIVEIWYYGMGDVVSYYKFDKGGKAFMIGWATAMDDPYQKPYYEWNGKKVSAKKFKSLLKKAAGSKKVKVTDKFWHKNTAANRKKMLSLVKW